MTRHPDETAGRLRPLRPALRRLALSAVAGIAVGALTATLGSWQYALALGWDVMAVVFCGWVWLVVWPLPAPETARQATAEDPNRAVSDLLMLSASVASLGAVGIVLVEAHAARGATQFMLAALGLASVAVSWFTVHTVFTLAYARLYYRDPPGGIDFNQPDPPRYQDFAYVALTIGMTFQVSDTTLQDSRVRGTALRQALLSYFFGAIILATAINLVASLGSSTTLTIGH